MLSISENHLRSFSSLVYVIETKLLEMQMALVAHHHKLRFAHIHYVDSMSEKEAKGIEDCINNMYDLLEKFCFEYNLPLKDANLKNELKIKANFLWENISGAVTRSLRGYGALDEQVKNDYELKVTGFIEAINKLIKHFN
jgi:hypothetical protein